MLVPCGQLVVSGIFQLDIAKIIGDVVLVQPCSRLLAGGAFGVADKGHVLRSCLISHRVSALFLPDSELPANTGHIFSVALRSVFWHPDCA